MIHTMALPGNPRGSTFRCGYSSSEGGRRSRDQRGRSPSNFHRATTLIRDAGPPKADQKAGVRGSHYSRLDRLQTAGDAAYVALRASRNSSTRSLPMTKTPRGPSLSQSQSLSVFDGSEPSQDKRSGASAFSLRNRPSDRVSPISSCDCDCDCDCQCYLICLSMGRRRGAAWRCSG